MHEDVSRTDDSDATWQHGIFEHAPGKCTREAWDVNEQAHNLTDWSQHYDQYGQGAFYGRIDELHLPGMQVFKEYTSQALDQQCHVWPDSLWIGIPAERQPCRINGYALEKGDIMCQPGGQDFALTTPDAFAIHCLVLRRDWLLTMVGESALTLLESDPQHTMRLGVSQKTRRAVTFLMERLLKRQRQGFEVQVHQGILSLAVTAILEERIPLTDRYPSYHHRRQVVERVREHVNGAAPVPISIDMLCGIAHVSQRTLHNSFTSILGISPMQFIRLNRLNQVRRRLCEPQATSTIGQIASDWGFYHLGQFAQDYRRLFGESPSHTLSRHRRKR
ncbi:helix-turn-helix domain-containing protein [Cobetia marina]|jgi:AraC family ethanolamine operon transcriptional activator|uniref:helix-turn-helix domain-containing protein n=1 Tax=Cobetia marina TaxID=28258 RepID=UPI0010AE7C39|nr:helix-turn-helix domain-containing protein [Cobetia marina]TKD64223.1 helix-turn-helix domain-containing protein [Cobetia marina]